MRYLLTKSRTRLGNFQGEDEIKEEGYNWNKGENTFRVNIGKGRLTKRVNLSRWIRFLTIDSSRSNRYLFTPGYTFLSIWPNLHDTMHIQLA